MTVKAKSYSERAASRGRTTREQRQAERAADLARLASIPARRRTARQQDVFARLREQQRIASRVQMREEAFAAGARTARQREEYIAMARRAEATGATEQRLRDKLARQFPAAISEYNNPFVGLTPLDLETLAFLDRLPRRVIAEAIRKRDMKALYEYLEEQGYEPPFFGPLGRNPLHYHYDPSQYGI